jgi:hypothetical protein
VICGWKKNIFADDMSDTDLYPPQQLDGGAKKKPAAKKAAKPKKPAAKKAKKPAAKKAPKRK